MRNSCVVNMEAKNQLSVSNMKKISAFHNAPMSAQNYQSKLYFDRPNNKIYPHKYNPRVRQNSIDQLHQPLSIYENFSFNPLNNMSRDSTLPLRKSRLFNQFQDINAKPTKPEIKRDLSMPPISNKLMSNVEIDILSQPNHSKLSVDADLNKDISILDDSLSYIYDSINTTGSITPPPVPIISTTSTVEYVNRKAIIRPLAFRPVQPEWTQTNCELSPTKPPVGMKTPKSSQNSRTSPPPVPPHASCSSTRPKLPAVQLTKSGDSSGYYSRATGTLTGTISSTDISPTMDESVSIYDIFPSGDVYSSTIEIANDLENLIRDSDRDVDSLKFSLDSEIMSERQRGKFLEASLINSNCKILEVESHISELKKRLTQKTNELNRAMDTMESLKHNLDLQHQKSLHLEMTIQSLRVLTSDRNVNCHQLKDQATQTIQFSDDVTAAKLLEQFEDERKTWLAEKFKVLSYQRQIENNFQQLLIKCRRLESYICKIKTQIKDNYTGASPSAANLVENQRHHSSSSNSIDASNRNYLNKINRIEVTEHQSSF